MDSISVGYHNHRLVQEIIAHAAQHRQHNPELILDFYLTYGQDVAQISHFFATYCSDLPRLLAQIDQILKGVPIITPDNGSYQIGKCLWKRGLIALDQFAGTMNLHMIVAKDQDDLAFYQARLKAAHPATIITDNPDIVRAMAKLNISAPGERPMITERALASAYRSLIGTKIKFSPLVQNYQNFCHLSPDNVLLGLDYQKIVTRSGVFPEDLTPDEREQLLATLDTVPIVNNLHYGIYSKIDPDFLAHRLMDGSPRSREIFHRYYNEEYDYDEVLGIMEGRRNPTYDELSILQTLLEAGAPRPPCLLKFEGSRASTEFLPFTEIFVPTPKLTFLINESVCPENLPKGFSYLATISSSTPLEFQTKLAKLQAAAQFHYTSPPTFIHKDLELRPSRFWEASPPQGDFRRVVPKSDLDPEYLHGLTAGRMLGLEIAPLDPSHLREILTLYPDQRRTLDITPYYWPPDVIQGLMRDGLL